ncbi:MAG: ABC-F family ATP-binding cassette domain-containing protein [Bacteroidota bacterium]
MNYLSAENLSRAYGDKVLFDGISFGIDQGQKIALIGVNGCGKSSLFKILAGLDAPDDGKVTVRKGVRLAFLPQEPDMPSELTVRDVVFASDLTAIQLLAEYEQLLLQVGEQAELQDRIDRLTAEIEAQDAWEYEVKIQQILSRLGVDFLDRHISELSGGQKKRVALAQALIGNPDLLIMDEPTNHLDLESIEWLEKFLSTSKQSILVVTHDRYFLDSITNEIFELDQGKLFKYKGNYAYFLEKKDERESQQLLDQEKARNLYSRELEWLRRSPKARGTKAKYRIDAAKDLEEKARYRPPNLPVNLQVKGRRIGGKTMEIKHLRKSYGELNILDNFTYTFGRRDRVGIIGPNGVGKTTFLRLLLEEEAADSGKIRVGETIVFGYYSQSGLKFKDNARVLDSVTEIAEEVEMSKRQSISASQLLEHFLFPRRMHSHLVSTLSGGEKRRLHLLRVLMANPNFLVLDEPTNDLDLVTLRRLEEFLFHFDGCLMVVTHDRFFMDRLVDHLFVFQGEGKIKDYPGSYSQYREWKQQQEQETISQEKAKDKSSTQRESTVSPRPEKKNSSKKLSYKDQREFDMLEPQIEELEEKKAALESQMNAGGSDFEALQELAKELERVSTELEEKTDRWLELSEMV